MRMISWYALTALFRICRNRSNEGSARCVASTVEWSSPPSPDSSFSTDAGASCPNASTFRTAPAKTSWNDPAGPRVSRDGACGSEIPEVEEMDEIGIDIFVSLPHQVDRTLDHILHRRDRRYVSLVSPRRPHEI